MYSYQQILNMATAASVALLAIDLLILINMKWCLLCFIGLGLVGILAVLTAIACQYVKSFRPSDSLSWRAFLLKSALKIYTATLANYTISKMRRAYASRSAMRAMQEKTLMALVKKGRETVFGRDHKFSEILGIDDFRAHVPVRDYADLDKYNQLAYRGESDVYFKGAVDYLAKTSGTTGKNKTFPMSRSLKSGLTFAFMSTLRCIEEFLAKVGRRSDIAPQMVLSVHPADRKNEFGISVGPVTKFFFSRGDACTTPDEAFIKVHDTKTGFYIHAVFGLWHETISDVSVFFPSSLITFMRSLSVNWESVLKDIESGRLNADKVSVDAELLDHLNRRLSPKPERAAQLRSLFGDGQDLSGFFEKAWPHVSYIILARSGSFHASYRYLRKYLGSVPAHCAWLIGTEGLGGINMSVVGDYETDVYHPFLTNSFFEYIQVDANGSDVGEPKLAHELKVGNLYETVATSYNCVRLRVGDVIKVVRMDGCAPVFEISHRKSHVLSVHVEKTTEKSVQACVMLAAQRLSCQVVDFTAADCFLYEPVANVSLGTRYYALFVELDCDRRLGDDDKLVFDRALRDSCENYELFRSEDHIDSMQVLQVRRGAFTDLKQEMMSANKDISDLQFKMPRVLKSEAHVKCLLEHRV